MKDFEIYRAHLPWTTKTPGLLAYVWIYHTTTHGATTRAAPIALHLSCACLLPFPSSSVFVPSMKTTSRDKHSHRWEPTVATVTAVQCSHWQTEYPHTHRVILAAGWAVQVSSTWTCRLHLPVRAGVCGPFNLVLKQSQHLKKWLSVQVQSTGNRDALQQHQVHQKMKTVFLFLMCYCGQLADLVSYFEHADEDRIKKARHKSSGHSGHPNPLYCPLCRRSVHYRWGCFLFFIPVRSTW